ncbi:hypothetical protein IX39_07415 [Chryseobacterium formosense]|uniref:Uncharacterized protein n=1 Tax=Chryseobacterium formosense TaxID=236814 RepID=A0A085Z7Q3_9FLAO|nr:hypothetical protein [Chryseobacterium formosense]KFF00467.1 hypothetical protein IX39_07415 [Chryseobacterium formosense]SFT34121.1 hypothetical protein SAMN05421857_0185 [Chryseobacterium formosense]
MNHEKKNAVKSILFYIIASLIVIAINVSGKFKSGQCTPNLDFLSILIVVLLNVILLIANVVKAFVFKKDTRLSTIIHSITLVILLIFINSNIV